MKKRVLSLMLAVLMLLSAFPLLALFAMAADPAEGPAEETTFDYNSLFVQKGLVLSMDFYDSNAFWQDAGAGKSYPFPKAVHQWTYRDGATYARAELAAQKVTFPTEDDDPRWNQLLFPNKEDRITTGTTVTFTPAFAAAVNKYRSTINAVLASATSLRAGAFTPGIYTPGPGSQSWHDQEGIYQDSCFSIQNGYAQFYAPVLTGNNYMQFGGNGADRGTYTAQYVMAPGTVSSSSSFLFRGIALRLQETTVAGEYTLVPGQYNNSILGATSLDSDPTVKFKPDTVADITMEVTHPEAVDGTVPGALSVRYNEDRVFSTSINYKNPEKVTNQILGTSIINFTQSSNASLYALRIYNRSLTDDEILLNHFADVCKWYRLNPGMFTSLNTGERVQVAALMSEVQVGDTKETADERKTLREDLQKKLSNAVKEIYYAALCIEDKTPLCESFRAVAQEYNADIDLLLSLPVEYRADVYTAVLSMEHYTTEGINAKIVTAINKVIERYYKDYILTSTLTYKDLYVRQENMKVWLDFFAARATDGNVYTDVGYVDPATGTLFDTANLAKDKRDKVTYGTSTTPARNDNIMMSKYVYKNVNEAFKLYDIADAGWAHTNIRAYGDGFLDCGKNNSLYVRSPGHTGDVTYQFVMDVDPDQGAEHASYQLDGFRSTFVRRKSNNAGTIEYPTYYSFGGWSADRSFVSPGNAALLTATQRPGETSSLGTVNGSKDVTITLDKRVGTDAGHYYRVEYDQDSEGRIACKFYLTDAQVKAMKESGEFDKYFETKKLGSYTVYRYKAQDPIGGRVAGTNGEEANEIDAIYLQTAYRAVSETKTETAYYLKYHLNNVTTSLNDYFYPYPQEDGTVLYKSTKGNAWVSSRTEGNKTLYTDAAGLQMNFVTNFINNSKITEVYENLNEDGVYGPISYFGRMTLSAYANGNLCYSYPDLPYQNSEVGSIGNAASLKIYAIRTYDCVLTPAEIRQNHFADLAGFYQFDLTFFSLLNETQRTTLYEAMASLDLGGNHVEANEQYKEVLADILYHFDSQTPAAEHFLQICKKYSLDVNSLLELSPVSRERVFQTFASIDPEARHFSAILQGMLEDAVRAEKQEHFAEATIHKLIDFNGWELRTKGAPAMRASYTANKDQIDLLVANGYRVRIGVVTMAGNAKDLTVGLNGTQVSGPAGSRVSILYDGTKDGAELKTSEEEINDSGMKFYADDYTFAEEIYPDAENYEVRYGSAGFVILSKEGEADVIYTVQATLRYSARGVYSLAEISQYAQARRNWSYETVHTVLSEVSDDYGYMSAVFGNHTVTDLRVSPKTIDRDTLTLINNIVSEYTGSVFATEADRGVGRGIVFVGALDTIYTGRYYGVTVQNGNLYLWYNDQRDAQALVDLFAEIIAVTGASETGGDTIYLPEGFTVVRKYRAPATTAAE